MLRERRRRTEEDWRTSDRVKRARNDIRDGAEIILRLAQVNALFPRRSLFFLGTKRFSLIAPSSRSKFEASNPLLFVFTTVFTSGRQELLRRYDAPVYPRAHSTMIILLYGSVSVTDVPLAQPYTGFRLVKVQEPGKGCVNIRIV